MARTRESKAERKAYVTIRSGRKKIRLQTWRYYSILNELRWLGADRGWAEIAAKWAKNAAKGEHFEIEPEITMEVAER